MTTRKTTLLPLAYSDAKAGMAVMLDGGFTCAPAGQVVLKEDEYGLYFDCDRGQHYIDGQEDWDGLLVGIFAIPEDLEGEL